VAESLLPASTFNETHWSLPRYGQLYKQANATADPAVRKEIEHEMQQIDFTQGGYIIPAFIDALDAYSTKITGYAAARVGQPLSDFNFEQFSFALPAKGSEGAIHVARVRSRVPRRPDHPGRWADRVV